MAQPAKSRVFLPAADEVMSAEIAVEGLAAGVAGKSHAFCRRFSE
jgi:hypothetical protein